MGSVRSIGALYAPDSGATNVGFLEYDNATLYDDSGRTMNWAAFSIVFQGYFWPASGAGDYTVSSRGLETDDTIMLWMGDTALGVAWNADNANYIVTRNGDDGTYSFTAEANYAIPLTVMSLQFYGDAKFDVNVQDPLGATYESADVAPFMLADCGTASPPNFLVGPQASASKL